MTHPPNNATPNDDRQGGFRHKTNRPNRTKPQHPPATLDVGAIEVEVVALADVAWTVTSAVDDEAMAELVLRNLVVVVRTDVAAVLTMSRATASKI